MTIRARMSRTLLLAFLPLVLAAGAGLYLFVRAALIARVDDGLFARAQSLAGMLGFEPTGLELDPTGDALPQYESSDSGEFFQVWTLADGAPASVVARSESLDGADLPVRVPDDTAAAWDATLEDHGRVRLTAMRFTARPDESDSASADDEAATPPPPGTPPDEPVVIVVARSRQELDRTLALLAAALGGAGVVLITGSLITVRVALHRGLLPIDHLAPHERERRCGAAPCPRAVRAGKDRR